MGTLLWCILLICTGTKSYAQHVVEIRSRDFGKLHEISYRDSLWFFHAGELSFNQNPFRDASGWDTLHYTAFGKLNPPRGWKGYGWFALWVKASPNLVGRKLAIRINHDGASEIFIDGRPMGGYGRVGRTARQMRAVRAPARLIPLWLNDTIPHLITIHYSNFFGVYPDFLGFQLWIGDYGAVSQRMSLGDRVFSFVLMCAAAQLILGLLHFLLFLFYPGQKLNLYYTVFVVLLGINGIGVYLYYRSYSPTIQHHAELITEQCKALLMWAEVMLLYILDRGRAPRLRAIALSTVTVFYMVVYVYKYLFPAASWNDYFSIAFFVFIMDGCWSAVHIVRKRQRGVWLVGAGVMVVILSYFFAWADVFHLWPYRLNAVRIFVMSAGELVLPLCLSLYLALDFARTNHNLAGKLSEVKMLSARALAQEAERRELIAGEAKRLEDLVQQRTAELKEQADKLREMDDVKSRLFTNITHEFKTPLTLIINPAQELLSKLPDDDERRHLSLIYNNATRLLGLINQLLDLNKLESGLMELNYEPADLVALIRTHVSSYESLMVQKGISLYFKSDWNTLPIMADCDKLDKVILNLLSNALKFTNTGKIEVSLRRGDDTAGDRFTLVVRDTGRGIPPEKLPYIFTRFYQVDPSGTRATGGTGVGLALVKELVELMGGRIEVESAMGIFTEIRISISYLAAAAVPQAQQGTAPDTRFPPEPDSRPNKTADNDVSLVLLIEDHDELRDFIARLLSVKYRVLTAKDGAEGIALGFEHIPNLIITDVMMPVVDGYELSAAFKNDERTSHIPVVILTAKADIDSRIQGIETGADAYLAKPFDKRELFALIENLISLRNQLRERYSSHNLWLSDTFSMPPIEHEFIMRVRRAVENHLNEDGYSADQLALDIGLSRTQLHRKLKALIGQAPGELIRIVRLQYARNLLERRVATVAEVAYMVGFSSPASFSASFSRHFGFPPKMAAGEP